jgi:uncharacterized protein (DUF486 family)
MPPHLKTILLLTCSNVFMTFAWYAHLKDLKEKPWVIAALFSWGIALFEYLLQVPAWDYLWAGLCLMGAVYFVFRQQISS